MSCLDLWARWRYLTTWFLPEFIGTAAHPAAAGAHGAVHPSALASLAALPVALPMAPVVFSPLSHSPAFRTMRVAIITTFFAYIIDFIIFFLSSSESS